MKVLNNILYYNLDNYLQNQIIKEMTEKKMHKIEDKKIEKTKTYWIVRQAIRDEIEECHKNDTYKIPFFSLLGFVAFLFIIIGMSQPYL